MGQDMHSLEKKQENSSWFSFWKVLVCLSADYGSIHFNMNK